MRTTKLDCYRSLWRYVYARQGLEKCALLCSQKIKGEFSAWARDAVPIATCWQQDGIGYGTLPVYGIEESGYGTKVFRCEPGQSGNSTIHWWPSCGLGPSSLRRGEAAQLIDAAASQIEEVLRMQALVTVGA